MNKAQIAGVALLLVCLFSVNAPCQTIAPLARARTKETPEPAYEKSLPSRKLYENLYAVVIGINKYKSNDLPELQYALNDSLEMKKKLISLGFPSRNVYVLLDSQATRTNVISLIRNKLYPLTEKSSGVFVFFAGHGTYGVTNNARGEKVERGYILLYDSLTASLESTAISLDLLTDLLDNLSSKHVLLTIDACHSGFALRRSSTNEKYIEKLVSKRSRYVITAGGRMELAGEIAGHGIFTEKLLGALDGMADLDMDGYVTASELGTYLKSAVSRLSDNLQTPIFGVLDGEGEFVFEVARNRPEYGRYIRANLINSQKYETHYADGIKFFKAGNLQNAKNSFEQALKYRENDYWASQKLRYIAEFKPYKKQINLQDGSTLKLIKGDRFYMGEDHEGFENERPKRLEMISDYYLSQYEVTIAQYDDYLNKTGKTAPLMFDLQRETYSQNAPVQGVSWEDACAYCTYHHARLPSEKEWEFAARGTDGRRFVNGAEFRDHNSVNWQGDGAFKGPSPAGAFPKDQSIFKIFDMSGNVREWVDNVDAGYLLQELPLDNSGTRFKVVRGGSYKTRAQNLLRLSVRTFRHPQQQAIGIGFRCAKTPDQGDYE